ncbi:G-protein-signaling modulator 2 [Stylophora pistillata]|uniref:G-protein-signaling modulator 2 n=1 Tax=Stylophora pistillata TaxID=50429 RepID=A0A2B4RYP2_STYPI|nr:G-protein-signaling modulator 2 [Stylophora pistillata]
MQIEICDRNGEATNYRNLGNLFLSLSKYEKAQKYLEKALTIQRVIGDRNGEASSYEKLGNLFKSIGKYEKAREYIEKALIIRMEIGDRIGEASNYGDLGALFGSLGKCEKALEYMEKALTIQIEIGDRNGEASNYGILGSLFGSLGKCRKARECIEKAHTINKEIGHRIGKASNYEILGPLLSTLGDYEEKASLDKNVKTEFVPDLDEFFTESFRGLGILPAQNCEDRSLDDTDSLSDHYRNCALLRDCEDKHIKKNLDLCYKIIVAPVADLLKEPEVIIHPDSCMYQVPFAALTNEEGKYLSESSKLRIVPSLTTLKLIQHSPPQYHSQTDALIVHG